MSIVIAKIESILYTIQRKGGENMIASNLSTILGEKRIKISKVIKDTKISRPTLTALYYNNSKGINFDTLNTLCNYLQVSVNDILFFYPVDIDTISINFDDPTIDNVNVNEYRTVELITDVHFHGIITFIQKNISSLEFCGYLDQPDYLHSTYNLDLTLYHSNIENDKIEEYILNSLEDEIINEFPVETGFENDSFSIDTIHIDYSNDKSK